MTRGRVTVDLDAPGVSDDLIGSRVRVAAPDVERGLGVLPAAAGHQGGAPLLMGPLFEPVQHAIEQLRFPEARGLAQRQLSGQGGLAGTHRKLAGKPPRIASEVTPARTSFGQQLRQIGAFRRTLRPAAGVEGAGG